MNEELRNLLEQVLNAQRAIRDRVIEVCASQSSEQLAKVVNDGAGDTIFAIDKVSEQELVSRFEGIAASFGGFVLIAEGLGGEVCLPRGRASADLRYRIIVDPIDGTRAIMYQKRSAWVLTAVAPNRGPETSLSDVVLCAQTEIPPLKQNLCDELWAVRGQGTCAQRYDRVSGVTSPIQLRPSSAETIEQGYAMIGRFFPGARDELASIDEEVIRDVLGPSPAGKALCFEDQYPSTGGQLYELLSGRDRFNADLRPLMNTVLQARGQPNGLCCHPYDICTALLAEELGVVLTSPSGERLDVVLNLEADVAWVGYANAAIRAQVEPALQRVLKVRRLS